MHNEGSQPLVTGVRGPTIIRVSYWHRKDCRNVSVGACIHGHPVQASFGDAIGGSDMGPECLHVADGTDGAGNSHPLRRFGLLKQRLDGLKQEEGGEHVDVETRGHILDAHAVKRSETFCA